MSSSSVLLPNVFVAKLMKKKKKLASAALFGIHGPARSLSSLPLRLSSYFYQPFPLEAALLRRFCLSLTLRGVPGALGTPPWSPSFYFLLSSQSLSFMRARVFPSGRGARGLMAHRPPSPALPSLPVACALASPSPSSPPLWLSDRRPSALRTPGLPLV